MVFERFRLLFEKFRSKPKDLVSFKVRYSSVLHGHLLTAVGTAALDEAEIAAAVAAESESLRGQLLSLHWPGQIERVLDRFLSGGLSLRQCVADVDSADQVAAGKGIRFRNLEPIWTFALGEDFIKSIDRMDKKLQGRILEAITRIAHAPTTAFGDTIKPLTSDLRGLWRYRVGDYRLIYCPDAEAKRITLLSFGARGGAYC